MTPKELVYYYLQDELYTFPSCDTCQYSDINAKRVPCNKCDGWDKYKLHKGHKADLKRMAREITKIVKDNK